MWVLKYVAAFSKYWQCLLLVLHFKGHTKQRPLFLGTRTCDITALEKPAGPDLAGVPDGDGCSGAGPEVRTHAVV